MNTVYPIGTKVILPECQTRFQRNVDVMGTIVARYREGRRGYNYEVRTDKYSIMHYGEYTRTLMLYSHEIQTVR